MSSLHLELITHLSHGLGQRAYYHSDHPRVTASAEGFVSELRQTLDELGRAEFFLGVAEGRLVHEGHFLVGATLQGRRVMSLAQRLHCGGFLFRRGVDVPQTITLFALAVQGGASFADLAEANAWLAENGVTDIELSPVYSDPGWFGQFAFDGVEVRGAVDPADAGLARAVPVYHSLFEAVETAHGKAGNDHQIDVAGTRSVSELLLANTRDGFGDLLRCVQYPDYDSYTIGHSVRVALFAVMVADRLGLPPQFLIELCTAGLLHDVGKAKIPSEILYKPARLDADERQIMSRHPELGAEILLENPTVEPLAIGCAFGHHMRHDGKGYPLPTPWAASGAVTALVTACDVFEALTAVRPYKPAFSPRRTYELMLEDRGAFDPAVLDALVRTLGFYPPGNEVLLSNGARARVVAAGRHPALPRVRLTHDEQGAALEELVELELDGPEARGARVAELYGERTGTQAALPAPETDELQDASPDSARLCG